MVPGPFHFIEHFLFYLFSDAVVLSIFQTYLLQVYHEPSSVVQGLDFSGIEQVTDEVIIVLVSVAVQDNRASSLQHISFAGCIHLTDHGVYQLAKCFKNLLKVRPHFIYLLDSQFHGGGINNSKN
jgi:hypothetical protein